MNKWDIYLGEAKTQAAFAKRAYDAFRAAENKSSVIEVFFHLHHFLVHATNIDRILAAEPGSERYAILDGHLDLSGLDLKAFRRLRNHVAVWMIREWLSARLDPERWFFILATRDSMPKKRNRRHETWEEPRELARIRESFTEQKKRVEFEKIFGRLPQSDSELEVRFEFYTTELYNSGHDVP